MIIIEIPHEPISWKAHAGFGRKSFNVRFRERELYQWEIKRQYSGLPKKGAVRIVCTYYMPIPKSTSVVKRKAMQEHKIHHTKRPDIDNLNKFLCDCLKGLVFADDSQVVFLLAQKVFGENPKTVIQIEAID